MQITTLFNKYTFMVPDKIVNREKMIPSLDILSNCQKENSKTSVTSNKVLKKGGHGQIKIYKIHQNKKKLYEYVVKTLLDNQNKNQSIILQNERICNRIISRYVTNLFNPQIQTESFLKIESTFITKYIGFSKEPSSEPFRLAFEKAHGQNLAAKNFLKIPEPADTGEENLKQLKQQFFSENLRIVAQICAALTIIHQAGIIHRDLKLSNIVYDSVHQNIKLIDFGISYGPHRFRYPCLLAYCSSPEEYKLAQILSKGSDKQAKTDLHKTITFASDIYGLGLILFQIFFRTHGWEYFLKTFNKTPHNNFQENIEARTNFYINIADNLSQLNAALPQYLQYSSEELSFITNITKICIDPIPTNRPNAAQVCALCEFWEAGVTDFEQSLKMAQELRSSTQFSEDTLAVYEKYSLAQS